MTPEYIIIHHSLTDDSETVSWEAIRRWHMGLIAGSPYQMRDIGYHYGIELVGDDYEIMKGRREDEIGAHCKEMGMNHKSLGICLVGNFDVAPLPEPQWQKAVGLVAELVDSYEIVVPDILGHREVGLLAGFDWRTGRYKTCPGAAFDLDRFRADVGRHQSDRPSDLSVQSQLDELRDRIQTLEARGPMVTANTDWVLRGPILEEE